MKLFYQMHLPLDLAKNLVVSAVKSAALLVLSTFCVTSIQVRAATALDGYFIALESCEAFHSKNKRTNPGEIKTAVMMAYVVKGINKPSGDYLQIVVPDAPVTEERWVLASCGAHVVEAKKAAINKERFDTVEAKPSTSRESTQNVLALSWQPAFCESKPNKAECQKLNKGRLPITEQQLSIHGLWAQPRNNVYCGVPKSIRALDKERRWNQLPEPVLSADTRKRLAVAMPGTASLLERHEWIKHGTCHRGDGGAEEYYADTLIVSKLINESVVADFLASKVGKKVSTQAIRDKFDEAFGANVGERVQFDCGNDQGRILLQELLIHLSGAIDEDANVGALMRAAKAVPLGCPEGVIDPAGLQ